MVKKILYWGSRNVLYVENFSEDGETLSGDVINGGWRYTHNKSTLELSTGRGVYIRPLPMVYEVDPKWVGNYNDIIYEFLEWHHRKT